MKKLIKRSISITLVFLMFINVIYLSNPLDKAYANSLDENKYIYSSSDPQITNISLSPTARIGSFQSLPENKTVNSSKTMLINEVQSGVMATEGAATNLIKNGDFELSPSESGSWEAYSDSTSGDARLIWDGDTYHGNEEIGRSICITGSAISVQVINEVSIEPGKTYSFSAWGKADNIVASENEAGSFIYIGQYDRSGTEISNSTNYFTNDGTFDWSEANISFVAETNSVSVIIMLGLDGSGTVWYDDVSLTEVATTIPVTDLTLNISSLSMKVGDTNQLITTVLPENATNRNVVWSIQSGSDVVSISSEGLVEALKAGTTIVRATSVSDETKYAECSITVEELSVILLPTNAVITDSVIDPLQPVLYAVDSANSKVYALNYETKSIKEISFSLKPERITFNNGKLYITLLKAAHSSYTYDGSQSGAIAVVDASNLSLLEQIDVDTDPYDIVVSGDVIYLTSGSGQWTSIKSYSETSKQLISRYSIREASYAEFNSALNRVYTIETCSSPDDYEAYDVNNGIFTGSHDSPYHGDYMMASNFRISPDGKYVFNGSGLILTCDANKSNDLYFKFMLSKSFTDIAFDSANNRFYTAVSGKAIYSYDYNTFNGIGTYSTTGDVKNLYYRDNKLIAISKTGDNQYIFETIDTEGGSTTEPTNVVTTVQLQKSGDNWGLNYSINDSVIDPSKTVVYITDTTNNKIASINYETGEAKEVSTYYSPESIAYYHDELYIGYGSQSKIEIYDAQTLILKDVIFTGAAFFDLNIGNDGYIYTTSNTYARSYSNDYARSYSRTSKQEISKFYMFHKGYLEVHPTLNSLYMTSMDVTPSDLYVLNYSAGSLTIKYDSPYHGDYSIANNNKISPDGKYIFNASGNIFRSSSDELKNMYFCIKLNKEFSDVAFDLENNRFYTGVSGNFIYVYNYSTFEGIDTYSTQGKVKKLYSRNGKLVAVSSTSQGNDIIEIIDPALSSNIPGKINNVLISQTSPYSCIITWNTDELTSSQVEYGLTQNYGSISSIDPTQVKNHSVLIKDLSPDTTYHFKLHSISDTIDIASNDIMFVTEDLPSIDLGTAISRIIYDTSSNKAYAVDNIHTKLLVIDLENHVLENTIVLSTKPDDLCLSEDSKKLYIVNFDGTVAEFDTETLNKVRDIVISLPKFNATDTHYHIKYANDKLYLIDGASAPALWSLDLNTLSETKISNVDSIGDIIFSKNSDFCYSWYQFGWRAGLPGSYIQKYVVGNSNITGVGTSKSTSPSGLDRDPLDTPIMLIDEQNKLLTKNKVFDTNNFTELNTFTEGIYAVSSDGIFAAGKNSVYNISDYQKVADTSKKGSDMMFFDNDRNLFYVVNWQSRIYYDSTFSIPAPNIQVTCVSISTTSSALNVGDTEQLSAKVLPEDTTNKNVVWSIQSGSDVVLVSTDGLVKALKAGTAIVRATSVEDETKYVECIITVVASSATELAGFTWAQGSIAGTTRATVVPTGTLKYIVGDAGSQVQPNVGDVATAYTNNLNANTDIAVSAGQHIFIIRVGSEDTITDWTDVTVVADNIKLIAAVPTYGDLNDDGSIDCIDFALLRKTLLMGVPESVNLSAADLNVDGDVNAIDYAILKIYLMRIIDSLPYLI